MGSPPPQVVRRIVGFSLVPATLRPTPEPDLEAAGRLAEARRAAFLERRGRPAERDRGDEPLFPGAREALEAVAARGIPMGVATVTAMRGCASPSPITAWSASSAPSRPPACTRASRTPPCSRRWCARPARSPPRPSWSATPPSTPVGVVLMAKAAGAVPVGVAWGNHPEAELRAAGAAHMLPHVDQLADLPPPPP